MPTHKHWSLRTLYDSARGPLPLWRPYRGVNSRPGIEKWGWLAGTPDYSISGRLLRQAGQFLETPYVLAEGKDKQTEWKTGERKREGEMKEKPK